MRVIHKSLNADLRKEGSCMEDIYIGGKKPIDDNSTAQDIYITPRRRQQPVYEPPQEPLYPEEPEEPEYEPDEPEEKKPKKKKKKPKLFRRIKAIILVAVVLLGVLVGMVYHTFSSINYSETGHGENVFLDEDKLMQSVNVKNILLIGVDRRNADEASRSDTMLMVSLNTKTKKIKLTSFMRDTYVYIPERQKNAKLNAACTWGGAQMVMDTIEYNFNVRIDHYMLVDFTMFEDIINGLGGIDVEITEKEAKYMRDKVHLKNIRSGEDVHLNGKEALWYCRIRALDSDFMRTKRQRKVMTALIEKVKHTNPIELYELMGEIVSLIETDMSPATLTGLAVNGLFRYLRYDIEQGSVPAEGTWQSKRVSGQSVLKVDLGANQDYLEELIYEE